MLASRRLNARSVASPDACPTLERLWPPRRRPISALREVLRSRHVSMRCSASRAAAARDRRARREAGARAWPGSRRRSVSAARFASMRVRSRRSSVRTGGRIPFSLGNALAAACAFPRARSTAFGWLRSRSGPGGTRRPAMKGPSLPFPPKLSVASLAPTRDRPPRHPTSRSHNAAPGVSREGGSPGAVGRCQPTRRDIRFRRLRGCP